MYMPFFSTLCGLQVHFEGLCRDLLGVELGPGAKSLAEEALMCQWGSLAWAKCMATLEKLLVEQTKPAALQLAVTPVVLAAYGAVFDRNLSDHKLKRFSELHRLLSSELLPLRITQAISAAAPTIHAMVHGSLAELYVATQASYSFTDKRVALCGCLVSHLMAALEGFTKAQCMILPADFELVEDVQVRAQRFALKNTLQALSYASCKIFEIEGAIDAS